MKAHTVSQGQLQLQESFLFRLCLITFQSLALCVFAACITQHHRKQRDFSVTHFSFGDLKSEYWKISVCDIAISLLNVGCVTTAETNKISAGLAGRNEGREGGEENDEWEAGRRFTELFSFSRHTRHGRMEKYLEKS